MATVFCSDQDVKTQAPIAAGFTSRFDNLIPIYIDTVSQQIRDMCNRNFDKAEYTEYRMSPDSFNYPEPYKIWVGEAPIESGTVFLDYDPRGQFIENYSSITELVENTDFVVDYEDGLITVINQSLCYHPRGLRLIYNGGYVATSGILAVPTPIKAACIMQVTFILQRIAASQSGQTQEKANRGGNSHMFSQDGQSGLIGEVASMLRQFRMPLIGSR